VLQEQAGMELSSTTELRRAAARRWTRTHCCCWTVVDNSTAAPQM